MERTQSDPIAEWSTPGGQTGLEEPMWQLGLGGGSKSYPERPDEADCIYYLRTGFCGYDSRCRFNHPRDRGSNLDMLTILLLGKGGVGKSSTVNSIVGESAVAVNAFQSEGPRPVMVSRSREGFTLNIIYTPGLVEGGYVNDQALDLIKRC